MTPMVSALRGSTLSHNGFNLSQMSETLSNIYLRNCKNRSLMCLAMKQISVDLLITDTECIHLPTEATRYQLA